MLLSRKLTLHFKIVLAALSFALASLPPALAQPGSDGVIVGEPQKLPRSRLTIRTASGKKLNFTVEVAATPDQQAIGMMFRASMPQDNGMLFIYRNPQPLAYWMENTYLPLDLIFIGQDGRILNVAANAKPLSRQPILSAGQAVGVLEINGGQAAALGIAPGDRVEHAQLATRARK